VQARAGEQLVYLLLLLASGPAGALCASSALDYLRATQSAARLCCLMLDASCSLLYAGHCPAEATRPPSNKDKERAPNQIGRLAQGKRAAPEQQIVLIPRHFANRSSSSFSASSLGFALWDWAPK